MVSRNFSGGSGDCSLLSAAASGYVICVDESPVMAFDREEIEARFPGTLFAVSREEWEESQDFQQASGLMKSGSC